MLRSHPVNPTFYSWWKLFKTWFGKYIREIMQSLWQTTCKCSGLKIYFWFTSHLAVVGRGMGRALFHLVIQGATSIQWPAFLGALDSSAGSLALSKLARHRWELGGSHWPYPHFISWSESHESTQMQVMHQEKGDCPRKSVPLDFLLYLLHATYLKPRSTFIVNIDLAVNSSGINIKTIYSPSPILW